MKKSIITFCIVMALVLLTGCNASKGVLSKESLASTGWELSQMNGKSVTDADYPNKMPNVTFTADNKVGGHGGCNRYGGSYTLENDGKITFGQMISTKMFCQGVREDDYMNALSKITKAKIEGNNLVLYNGEDAVLVFVPKALN